jgi:hypothetical protein
MQGKKAKTNRNNILFYSQLAADASPQAFTDRMAGR